MQTLSLESLSMTTSTRSVSWFGGINQRCAVCCVNLLEQTPLWRMTWHSKPSFALIKTSVVFAAKRASQRGFTGSPTIVFVKTRAVGRNLWESMKNNSKRNTTPRWQVLV